MVDAKGLLRFEEFYIHALTTAKIYSHQRKLMDIKIVASFLLE